MYSEVVGVQADEVQAEEVPWADDGVVDWVMGEAGEVEEPVEVPLP